MFKVLKFAKDKWYIIILIILLIFVQVYCELTLPDYTSDIVDVGIQGKGVKYPVPEKLTADSFDNLKLFMAETDKEIADKYYNQNDNKYEAALDGLSEDELEELKSAMLVPQMLTMLLSSDSEEAKMMQKGLAGAFGIPESEIEKTDIMELFRNMPDVQRNAIREALEKQMKDYPEYKALETYDELYDEIVKAL